MYNENDFHYLYATMNTNATDLYQSWLSSLQNSGYLLTETRRALVEILAASSHALSAVELYDLGRRECPRLGLVTVYRTLEKLEELGLIQRVHQPGGCHMYLRAAQGHQHLLLCTACGRAEYFDGDDLSTFMNSVADQSGFDVRDHWLQLFGLCQQCRDHDL